MFLIGELDKANTDLKSSQSSNGHFTSPALPVACLWHFILLGFSELGRYSSAFGCFWWRKKDWPGQFSALPTSSENSALTLNVDTNILVPTPGLFLKKTENRAENVAQWESARSACLRTSAWIPAPQHKQKRISILLYILYMWGFSRKTYGLWSSRSSSGSLPVEYLTVQEWFSPKAGCLSWASA